MYDEVWYNKFIWLHYWLKCAADVETQVETSEAIGRRSQHEMDTQTDESPRSIIPPPRPAKNRLQHEHVKPTPSSSDDDDDDDDDGDTKRKHKHHHHRSKTDRRHRYKHDRDTESPSRKNLFQNFAFY